MMYILMALMKNGKTIPVASAPTHEELDAKSVRLETAMMDPTSAKLVFRDGDTTVLAREVAATWVERDGDE